MIVRVTTILIGFSICVFTKW